jgi:uncharacterized protein YqiB (DUF1249 family)
MAQGRYRVDLIADGAECDANYVRMHRLLPELFDTDLRSVVLSLPGGDTATGAGERTLAFRVMERCPYTTTVSVRFQPGQEDWHAMLPAPHLTVRLYHDARTAEVTAYQGEDRFRGRYEYPNGQGRQPDEKAQLNRFLGEYLALCLAHGREPRPVAVPAGAPDRR